MKLIGLFILCFISVHAQFEEPGSLKSSEENPFANDISLFLKTSKPTKSLAFNEMDLFCVTVLNAPMEAAGDLDLNATTENRLLVVLINQSTGTATYDVLHPVSLDSLIAEKVELQFLAGFFEHCTSNDNEFCRVQCETSFFSVSESSRKPYLTILDNSYYVTYDMTTGDIITGPFLHSFDGEITANTFPSIFVYEDVPYIAVVGTYLFFDVRFRIRNAVSLSLVCSAIVNANPNALDEVASLRVLNKSSEVEEPLIGIVTRREDTILYNLQCNELYRFGAIISQNLLHSKTTPVLLKTNELEAIVAPAAGRQILYDINTEETLRVLCCYPAIVERSDGVILEDGTIGIILKNTDGEVQYWNIEPTSLDEYLEVIYTDHSPNITNDFLYTDTQKQKRLIIYNEAELNLYYAGPPPPEDTRLSLFQYYMNLSIIVVVAVLTFKLFKYKKARNDSSEKSTAEGLIKSCCALFGIKHSLAYYTVVRLPDYRPQKIRIFPKFIPKLGQVKVSLSNLLLVFYLAFVAICFSPNILGSLISSGDYVSPSETCKFREEKLAEINSIILNRNNFTAAQKQVKEAEFTLLYMEEKIAEKAADPVNPLFPNFPDGASQDCEEIADKKREELLRQINDNSCTYETETFRYVTGDLRWQPVAKYLAACTTIIGCFFPPDAEDVVVLDTITLPPDDKNQRPCPVDVSLLDDLQEARGIINRYVQPPERKFEEGLEEFEDAAGELLQKLSFQINLAADIYIAYVCICLYITAPVRLYKSKLSTIAKRTWFSMSQTVFIFWFTLIAYMYPKIIELLDIADFLQYIHNVQVDICYIQPSFLADVSGTIFKACEQMDILSRNYSEYGRLIRNLNLDAQQYYICDEDTRALVEEEIFIPFDQFAENTLAVNFSGSLCDEEDELAYESEFSSAPGTPSGNVFSVLLSLGVLAQLFGKFILVNFGLSLLKVKDPLSFHDGKVETIGGEEVEVPPAKEVAKFLRLQREPILFQQTILVSFFAGNMIYLLLVQLPTATPLNIGLFVLIACIVVLVSLVILKGLNRVTKDIDHDDLTVIRVKRTTVESNVSN